MEPERVGNFLIWSRDSTTDALVMAYEMASGMDAEVHPVTMYRQGERYQVVGAMRFGLVARTLYSESARKGSSLDSLVSATNRPKDSSHTAEIVDYVKDNLRGKYVFGALTLNARQELNLVVAGRGGQADLRQGFLILPRSAKVSITDGQHRQQAVAALMESERLPAEDRMELARQAVAVIIMNETQVDQIHQDFADASKAKMLPPSLLAMFDTRNPANRMIPLLEKSCPLLQGRIEPASKTAGKNSPRLYTTNQVRSFLKEFLTGSWQLGDDEFESRAQRLLSNDEKFQHEMGKAVAYINRVTDAIPVMRQFSELRTDAPLSKVAEIRDNPDAGGGYVCLSATGLVILGRIGHEILAKYADTGTEPNWQTFADRLGTVLWEKNAPIWKGNVVASHTVKGRKGQADRAGLRILQATNPISIAAELVRTKIGLKLEDATLNLGEAGQQHITTPTLVSA
jgi:DNA sulfur modification protein DndB